MLKQKDNKFSHQMINGKRKKKKRIFRTIIRTGLLKEEKKEGTFPINGSMISKRLHKIGEGRH